MTVLVDTYEVPACAIMPQLYNMQCYEVLLDEVYAKSLSSRKDTKSFVVLKDINPKTLLAVRDVESVIYIFHREILSEKEYNVLKYYSNELICVQNKRVTIFNKKKNREDVYQIQQKRDSVTHVVTYFLTKVEVPEHSKAAHGRAIGSTLPKKERALKQAALPFTQAQSEQPVYFPEEEIEEEDSESQSD